MMNTFKLRIPTIMDIDYIKSTLTKEQFDKLHWFPEGIHPPYEKYVYKHFWGEFHLADRGTDPKYHNAIAGGRLPHEGGQYAYTANAQSPAAFRPVLEPVGETDLQCIADGTIIKMGAFFLGSSRIPVPGENEIPPEWSDHNCLGGSKYSLNPYAEGDAAISWMKCGNRLIADRCLMDRVTYQQLEEQGLVQGTVVAMPFDKAVSKMFYEEFSRQPDSPQRCKADIMYELSLDLNMADPECGYRLDVDTMYALADKIHACWLFEDSIAMHDVTQHAAILIKNGVQSLSWNDENGEHHCKNFSPEVTLMALKHCEQDVFNILIEREMGADMEDISYPSYHEKFMTAVRLLEHCENVIETLKNKKPFLDDMIAGAKARTEPAPTENKSPDHSL